MTKHEISNAYFEWMRKLIITDCNGSYEKLLRHLNNIDFYYRLEMDANRFDDGINLRYRFGDDTGIESVIISNCLDIKDCSILEMLIALAMRCENNIMDNPDIGNRTSTWFWLMIKNMGLDQFADSVFNNIGVDEILYNFLEREYKSNGEGGLFIIDNCIVDLCDVEIWEQMCWYLDSIIV